MRKILKNELMGILENHKKWLEGDLRGVRAALSDANLSGADLRRADLSYADLRGANLSDTNLSDADLSGADLRRADLSYADLRGADLTEVDLRNVDLRYAVLIKADLSYAILRGAYFQGADLQRADLIEADLRYADLRGTDLTGAQLSGANLTDVKYNHTTKFFALQCPEKGTFIAFKKAKNYIVELEVPEKAKRSSATTRKCRVSEAKILSITSIDGTEEIDEVRSDYNPNFIYKIGETVEVTNFDEDRWNECSAGIHCFITRQEAASINNSE